jgi:protein-S-isoprenylcysteine O-methyltransferase Ste14
VPANPNATYCVSDAGRHRIVPPIYLFAALLAEVGLHFYFPIRTIVPSPINLGGALFVALGLALTLWAAGLFRIAGTPIRPFRQSTALVTSGVYRITRNPMYLGMALVLLGVALLLGSIAALLPIPFFVWQIQRKFVLPEEAFLEGLFGEPYLGYKARVGRWL